MTNLSVCLNEISYNWTNKLAVWGPNLNLNESFCNINCHIVSMPTVLIIDQYSRFKVFSY